MTLRLTPAHRLSLTDQHVYPLRLTEAHVMGRCIGHRLTLGLKDRGREPEVYTRILFPQVSEFRLGAQALNSQVARMTPDAEAPAHDADL